MVDNLQSIAQKLFQRSIVNQWGYVATEIATQSVILICIVTVPFNPGLSVFGKSVAYLHVVAHAQPTCRIADP